MIRPAIHAVGRDNDGGFALVESIVVLVLGALVFLGLTIAGELVMRHARATADRVNQAEMLVSGIEAWTRDVAAAFNPPAGPEGDTRLAFHGDERGLGFATATGGLSGAADIVWISAGSAAGALLRSSVTLNDDVLDFEAARRSETTILLRGPWEYRFAYAASGGRDWVSRWDRADMLPALVRLTVHRAGDARRTMASVVVAPHVNVIDECAVPDGPGCDTRAAEIAEVFDERH